MPSACTICKTSHYRNDEISDAFSKFLLPSLVQRSRMIEDIANRYSLPQTITKYTAANVQNLAFIHFFRFYTDLLQPKDSPTSLLLDSTSS